MDAKERCRCSDALDELPEQQGPTAGDYKRLAEEYQALLLAKLQALQPGPVHFSQRLCSELQPMEQMQPMQESRPMGPSPPKAPPPYLSVGSQWAIPAEPIAKAPPPTMPCTGPMPTVATAWGLHENPLGLSLQ